MKEFKNTRILVISRTPEDKEYMEDFFRHLPVGNEVEFVVNKFVSSDRFDFAVFDAHSLPPIPNMEAFMKLPEHEQGYIHLLTRYLTDGAVRYILWYGEYYHNLNRERCPSANSKFTLFARIRELIDFINNYRP